MQLRKCYILIATQARDESARLRYVHNNFITKEMVILNAIFQIHFMWQFMKAWIIHGDIGINLVEKLEI